MFLFVKFIEFVSWLEISNRIVFVFIVDGIDIGKVKFEGCGFILCFVVKINIYRFWKDL